MKRGVNRVAATVAIAVMIVPVVRTLESWLGRIGAPVSFDYGPAQLAVHVAMHVHGIAMYRDFRSPPYMPLVYGPIIPWLTAMFAPAFGSGPMAALIAGRAVTIASTIAACVLIVILARKDGASRAAAVLAAFGFLLTPIILRWGFDFRVDLPALAAELAGLALFVSGYGVPAVLMLAITFFIKQGRVAGIAAIVIYCALRGDRRRALALGGLWLALIAGGIAMLEMAEPWWWLNLVDAVGVPHYSVGASLLWLAVAIGNSPALVILAGVAILRGANARRLSVCYLGAAVIENFMLSLRWGSNAYYFAPSLAALAIIAANGIDQVAAYSQTIRSAASVAIGAALGIALLAGYLIAPAPVRAMTLGAAFMPRFRCTLIVPTPWDPAALARLRAVKGPIMTDTADLMLVDSRSNLEWIDMMVMNAMRTRGTFHDDRLLAEIRAKRIGAFALDAQGLNRAYRGRPLFWKPLRDAINDNYRQIDGIGPPILMLPRQSSP